MMRPVIAFLVFLSICLVPLLSEAAVIQFRPVISQEEAQSAPHDTYMFTNRANKEPKEVYVSKEVLLSGDDIRKMVVIKKENNPFKNYPIIDIYFTKDGSEKLKEITMGNIGEKLAVVIDDKVYMTPFIVYPLTKGHFRLTSWKIATNDAAGDMVKELGFGNPR